jgi:hypothetical protein
MSRSGGGHGYADIVVRDGMWQGRCTCGYRTIEHHYAETAMATLIDHVVNERAASRRVARAALASALSFASYASRRPR